MNKKNASQVVVVQGVIGFLLGTCLAVSGVGLFSVQRSVRVLNESYTQTYVAFVATDTPTVTPIMTPTSTSVPIPKTFYDALEESDLFLFEDPLLAISLINDALEDVSHPLDLGFGKRIIGQAYMILGDEDLSIQHYEQAIDLMLPLLDVNASLSDLSRTYLNLIIAYTGINDIDSSEELFLHMKEQLEPLARQSTNPVEIGEVYSNLIEAAQYTGDFFSTKSYSEAMRNQLDPMLDDLSSVEEIAKTYTYLSEASFYGSGEVEWDYGLEMVDRLKSLRDSLTSSEDILLVNRYLGDAEIFLGRYQFAAVYYQDLVEDEPTPKNIFILARTYDIAGNHACSYYWYQELLEIDDVSTVLYKDFAELRIGFIEEIYQELDEVPFCRQL